MTPQLCRCRHLCQYAAEHGLDAKLTRLRDWCCICDDRTPCTLCAPRDTPDRRQNRDRRREEDRRIARPVLEPILDQIETRIESRPLSIWRRLGPRFPWLPVAQIGRTLRTSGIVVLCAVGVVVVFAVQLEVDEFSCTKAGGGRARAHRGLRVLRAVRRREAQEQ